jgi:hypothetical protein
LRTGAAFAGGFSYKPFSRGAQAREKGGELQRGLKQTLEPLVGVGLAMTDEFEQTQLAVLLPHGGP